MEKAFTKFIAKTPFGYCNSRSMTFVILFFSRQLATFHKAIFINWLALFIPFPVNIILQKLNSVNMKKIIFGILLIGFAHFANAQIKGILDKAKQKTSKKSNEKVDKTIEKTTEPSSDKTEQETGETNDKAEPDTTKNETTAPATIKAYSKYDFVPGEKIIGFEDFSTGSIGDFPAGWNTNGAGEIVTVEGKSGRWLWLTNPGVFIP